jgi:TM2 domain-containing membrane protein YozV
MQDQDYTLPFNYPNLLEIEAQEERLREEVAQLKTDAKRTFYAHLNQKSKDPDTYAALVFLLFLGLHHAYLGQYKVFLAEATWQILMWCLLISHWYHYDSIASWAWLGLGVNAVFDGLHLFFSQRIVRWYNYQLARQQHTHLQQSS